MRIAKLIFLLLFAAVTGFLIGLLRPRRVVSRRDVTTSAAQNERNGGEIGD